jgi:DNA-binding NarL/FixJ family response regulator
MPTLRAVLVAAPPLLADLVRHVTTGDAGLSIIAEISDLEIAGRRLRDLAPDVVILGAAATAGTLNAARVRSMLPRARVLALTADFTQLFGPGEDDVNEFTPETLVDSLRR